MTSSQSDSLRRRRRLAIISCAVCAFLIPIWVLFARGHFPIVYNDDPVLNEQGFALISYYNHASYLSVLVVTWIGVFTAVVLALRAATSQNSIHWGLPILALGNYCLVAPFLLIAIGHWIHPSTVPYPIEDWANFLWLLSFPLAAAATVLLVKKRKRRPRLHQDERLESLPSQRRFWMLFSVVLAIDFIMVVTYLFVTEGDTGLHENWRMNRVAKILEQNETVISNFGENCSVRRLESGRQPPAMFAIIHGSGPGYRHESTRFEVSTGEGTQVILVEWYSAEKGLGIAVTKFRKLHSL